MNTWSTIELLPGVIATTEAPVTLWNCHVEDGIDPFPANSTSINHIESGCLLLILEVKGASNRREARVLVNDGTIGWLSTRWLVGLIKHEE